MNQVGLNPGHETGQDAALCPYCGRDQSRHAGIDREKYYKTREVDTCIQEILTLKMPGAFLGPAFTAQQCDLQPDNILLDP